MPEPTTALVAVDRWILPPRETPDASIAPTADNARMKRHDYPTVAMALAAVVVAIAAVGLAGCGGGSSLHGTYHPMRTAPVRVGKARALSGGAGIICEVTLDVHTRQGGVADLYYCHPDYSGCTLNGDCPDSRPETCVVGHGRRLAVDQARTDALPRNIRGGPEFSCPYHDEQS